MAGPRGRVIVTAHLELVPLTTRFVDAVLAGDALAASGEMGARVGSWLTRDPSHVVQLLLAGTSAEGWGDPDLGRAVVLVAPGRARNVIGSIGFHGPPDDRGRLEASCRIHPAFQGRGYASEAFVGLLDWATRQYGVTRFLIAVPARHETPGLVALEVGMDHRESTVARIESVAAVLDPGPAER